MTEKRFVGNFYKGMLVSIYDKVDDKNVNILQIVEIANQVVIENEQLKQSEKDCQEWNHKLINENEQLKQKVDELYENDKILRKQLVQDGILVKTDYFRETMKLLKELGHDDLYNDLNTTSLDMSVNCR